MLIGLLPACEGVRIPETGVTNSCELPGGVLGIELASYGKAANALNHGAISFPL